MGGEVLLGGKVALTPFAGRGVRAEHEQCNGGGGNADERNDERNTPGDVRG